MKMSNVSRLGLFLIAVLALSSPIQIWAFTDNIDLPFRDDPGVVGRWESVAYVPSIESFVPGRKYIKDSLFLKEIIFRPDGMTTTPIFTWTQGMLINSADRTAAKYVIKKIKDVEYMFLEWKAGDYVLRNLKPQYYVLIRSSNDAQLPGLVDKNASATKYIDCLLSAPLWGICKHPTGRVTPRQILKFLPHFDSHSKEIWQLDLRERDLSKSSLIGRVKDLLYASFDTKTKFPRELPKGFNPRRILELGENPGLGVRSLHKQGITGKGVSIAIIDQNLLVDHVEYSSRIQSYEELHWKSDWHEASMHAAAVVSIAAGKRCGVAPGANIYYIADWFGDDTAGIDYTFLAKAIDRVVSFNESAPKGSKIRVLTIERGFAPDEKGYADIGAAIERAKKSGIFVISSSLEHFYGFKFNGLGREPMSNPDVVSSYSLGMFLSRQGSSPDLDSSTLLVPMDSRTTAAPNGTVDYVFYREGGWSWSIPYIAGLYALACEVQPDITPEIFWQKALETGDILTVKRRGKKLRVGKIVNPVGLITSLRKRNR